MKTGIFCNYENHHHNSSRTIFEQVALVQQAETLGFESAWVSEHHFNEFNLSSSMLLLMAHLAGLTSTIQLGTAAVLLPFHNPIRTAEDIATLDNLCNGRLLFGVGKGGLFPQHNKHFGTPMAESRAKMLEAIALIQKLLYETDVSFKGQYYQCDCLSIYPQPLQNQIPVYIASGHDQSIEFAAQNSFGLMGGPPFSLERLKTTVAKYRALNASGSEKLVLARFFYLGKTNHEAVSEALPFIRKFSKKMQANSAYIMQNSSNSNQKPFDRTNICFDEDYLIENSIIGDVRTCRDKIKKFQDELNLATLALKPSSFVLQKNLDSLQRYNEEVRNYV
ncbi:LLM class flavin-dependent oxidoreductase [Umezakia ovalisporum]|uniref:LLM class flavin-dependent oxidoreductase n=1 Tax=Umezakia ovalisporum FSS-43 TaxID=2740520 RepID=A0ABT6K5Y3_9CYAN|nr:LLM class flavin-dependent oxidoreductase [Umezakia ovalisporum]MDH6057652.1 LLM class flavin-dependent oxidoreductase [Umezakia ovalisporum FSS-43]MDH6066018.1 LLM class flavin-dependent oxidoreductase [Umezakia ovalisporum APH033B]MDH6072460.1 LLM class flavin-dependent oxidoreductase [Umezakia ovalisporum CobakiLakeA]MDH6075758.1 LLM class flavin-dependent oxidoreductase [Umezakia ovalisporum CS-1034]MDH6079035.1 LLM class flavin-dependent oxidoreductase [Umezakia ovalisporum FSS-45]